MKVKPFISANKTVKEFTFRSMFLGLLLGLLAITGCSSEPVVENDPFHQVPNLIGKWAPSEAGLKPVRLQFFQDTLFVSYNGMARIDKYTSESDSSSALTYGGSIPLIDPEPVAPTSFVLIDSLLVVVNHARHLVVIYDRAGGFRQSFGTTPDGRPLASNAVRFTAEHQEGRVRWLAAEGMGFGHGVGLCQWGAIGRARAGQDYRRILTTYYPGARVERWY